MIVKMKYKRRKVFFLKRIRNDELNPSFPEQVLLDGHQPIAEPERIQVEQNA